MATRIVYTNQQLLDYSEEHLRYEFQMLRFVAERIPSAEGFARSALIESFAVHFRNLADFFYPGKLLADDLTAADFFVRTNFSLRAGSSSANTSSIDDAIFSCDRGGSGLIASILPLRTF